MKIAILALALLACGKDPAPAPIASEPARAELVEYATQRVFDKFLVDGQVVSRDESGEPDDRGDSPLYTGVLIGSLDCDRGAPVMGRLQRRIAENDGQLERFEPWADDVAQSRWSWDQEVGVTYAFARRAARCPSPALGLHWNIRQEAVARAGGRLHPDIDQKTPPTFDYVTDAVGHKLGLGGEPSKDAQRLFEFSAVTWTAGVVAAKAHCYRVHLAFRSMLSAEAVGRPIGGYGRSRFCHHTRNLGLPNVDKWCGRATDYLERFQFNEWRFRHDSCPWQGGPNGTPLRESPAIDLLDYAATQAANL